jgi:hypothetical protein
MRLYAQCMINTSDTPLRIGVCLWPSRITAFAVLPSGLVAIAVIFMGVYSEGAGTLTFQTDFFGFPQGLE